MIVYYKNFKGRINGVHVKDGDYPTDFYRLGREKLVGEGSVNSASISIRKIVEQALGSNAVSVVLAHNHPSGIAVPSGDDIQTTRRVAMALSAVDIYLADRVGPVDGQWTINVYNKEYRKYLIELLHQHHLHL